MDDWSKDKYYERQGEVCDRILRGEDPNFRDTIERINADDYTFEQFVEKYEKGSRPVIIKGVVDQWAAKESWQVKVSIYCSFLIGDTYRTYWKGSETEGSRLGRATQVAS